MRIDHRLHKSGKGYGKRQERGFSMIEVTLVCILIVIISVIAVPNIVQINRNYKLDAAGHSVASLLQQGRTQAVRTNLPTYSQYDTSSGMTYVSNAANTPFASGNPDVQLPSGLTFQNSPSVDHSQLDAYVGGTATQTPQIGGSVGFNARGLPCVEQNSNPLTCQTPPSAAGFEWFIQNQNGGWEAITVNLAGRVKSWRWISGAVWQ
jgi:Tfp pilus assembly protein FimT